MKSIIIALLLLTSISSYSQKDSSSKVAERLTTERIYSDVKEGFTKLVGNLEGPAKHVYAIYIRQHRTKGITKGFLSLFALIVFSFSLFGFSKKADWTDGNINAIITVVSFVALIISIIATFCYIGGDFNKVFNPEYYAIQDIIEVFK